MTLASKRIVDVIKSIPYGKVISYGGVASLADMPGGARQVSWLLSSQTEKYNLPWHRVISSKGTISIKDEYWGGIQRELLESEGVEFDDKNRINLNIYMWNGM